MSRSQTYLPYPNSHLLLGEAEDTVPPLKEQTDGTLSIIGSGQLVRSLHRLGLVDEYVLLIHPILLGTGQRLFSPGGREDLRLTKSAVTTTGVFIGQYDVRTGRGPR